MCQKKKKRSLDCLYVRRSTKMENSIKQERDIQACVSNTQLFTRVFQ